MNMMNYHQSLNKNGIENYQEIKDETEDEYPHEYEDDLNHNNNEVNNEEPTAQPFQVECQPSTERYLTFKPLVSDPKLPL